MHDMENEVRASLGIRLPEDYLAFMQLYGEKLTYDPVMQESWIPGLGDIYFVTGTTLAFRARIPDFPKEDIIIGYAGTKLIEEINEEIDIYLMLDSRNGSLHLVDSLGVSKALGKNFKEWMNESLRKVLLGERYSNRLVVIGFDDELKAGQLLSDLLKLQKDAMIDLEDAVVAVRKSDGKVKLNHVKSLTVKGALGGSLTGLIVGTLLYIPLIGAAVGAAAVAAAAALTDVGIDDRFIGELAATLKPCTSALFVLVRRVNPDELVKELKGRGGKVLVTTIGTEKEHELQSLLDLR